MLAFLVAFIKGVLFGITMTAIPGPIFFLIIQRTLSGGAYVGFLCGLGAVVANALYALIAAIGLTFIYQFMLTYQSIIALIGGAFLLYLGWTTFFKKPVLPSTQMFGNKRKLISAWLSSFILALTNPVTVIAYIVLFTGLGLGPGDFLASFMLVIGVILGSLLVVGGLVGLLYYFRKKLSPITLSLINKIAGVLLICFGIVAILRALTNMIG